MKALDLYCGGGGSSVGLYRAGFKVTGIDIVHNPDYPFAMWQGNVMALPVEIIRSYDFIWASPPCQEYSYASRGHRNNGKKYPDLIDRTRRLLIAAKKPFVIENVVGAPLRKDLMLCGEMFGLGVIRHRIFEIEGFVLKQIEHKKHKGYVKDGYYVTVAGNGGNDNGHNYCRLRGIPFKNKLECWQKAMDIDWITDTWALTQSVPPAYSRYIGEEFLKKQRKDGGNV